MSLNFKSLVSKKIFILFFLFLFIFGAFIYLHNHQQKIIIYSLLKTIFQCPNPNMVEIVNESTEDILMNDQQIVDISEYYFNKLDAIYGKYFTESAYHDFVRSRVPSQYTIICQEKNYSVRIIDIQIFEDKSSLNNGYVFKLKLSFGNQGDEKTVCENGYISFSTEHTNKINYFWVSDILLNELYTT